MPVCCFCREEVEKTTQIAAQMNDDGSLEYDDACWDCYEVLSEHWEVEFE